jgi:hypothetical protein
MTSRSLAYVAAFASPVFMAAAIAGWLTGVWPATSLTFALAAAAVVGGPLLAILHVLTAHEPEDDVEYSDEEPTRVLAVAAPERRQRRIPLDAVTLTPRLAAARQFQNWRDRPNQAILMREREAHFRRNQRRARQLRTERV